MLNEIKDCKVHSQLLPWAKVEGILAGTSVGSGKRGGVSIKHRVVEKLDVRIYKM